MEWAQGNISKERVKGHVCFVEGFETVIFGVLRNKELYLISAVLLYNRFVTMFPPGTNSVINSIFNNFLSNKLYQILMLVLNIHIKH